MLWMCDRQDGEDGHEHAHKGLGLGAVDGFVVYVAEGEMTMVLVGAVGGAERTLPLSMTAVDRSTVGFILVTI